MRLKRACLLRSLTWDILVYIMDSDLTQLSIVVTPQGTCRGMSLQLRKASLRKGTVWQI